MNNDFWKEKKILITGGGGFVGQHVIKNLLEKRKVDKEQLKLTDSKSFDLRVYNDAKQAVLGSDVVIHLAADVGGINYSNSHPATQFRNCVLMDINIFHACYEGRVNKLVSISSSVAYPEHASSPLKEEHLFEGWMAKTHYGYGFAKRNTVILTKLYRQEFGLNSVVLVPSDSYGPGEKLDLEIGHVIPSLIYKCLKHEVLNIWGDGEAVRDFLYVEDFAEGVILAAERLETHEPVNLGTGTATSIKELVDKIVKLTNFRGRVIFDKTKPKGQKARVVDISRAKKLLGFVPFYTLDEGLFKTVEWVRQEMK